MAQNIDINIRAQIDQALKSVKSLDNQLSGMSKTVKTLSLTFAGAFAGSKVIGFFNDAVKAAITYEKH